MVLDQLSVSKVQDHSSLHTVDVQTENKISTDIPLSNFEHMESMLSTMIEDAEQEPLDPVLFDDLQQTIISMEDNQGVRRDEGSLK
jgi:hypothetical protein